MKRLLVLFMAFALAGSVQAQSTSQSSEKNKMDRAEHAKSPEERAQAKTERLTEELKLTDEQQKAVYDVMLSQSTEREQHRMQKEEARKRAEASRKRGEQRILDILDENQQKLWKEKKAEMQEKRQDRVKHRRELRKRQVQPERR